MFVRSSAECDGVRRTHAETDRGAALARAFERAAFTAPTVVSMVVATFSSECPSTSLRMMAARVGAPGKPPARLRPVRDRQRRRNTLGRTLDRTRTFASGHDTR